MAAIKEKQAGSGARGPLKRMSATNAAAIKDSLALAMLTIEPEDRTQRQLFAALMPELYVLRMNGCGFGQLTALLNQCGFALQPSTVRTYYHEMLASKMAACEGRMDDQLAILKKVEQATRNDDIAALAARAIETREKQKARATASTATVVTRAPVETRSELMVPQLEKSGKSAPPSAAVVTTPIESPDNSGFGLLATGDNTVEVRPGGGFFEIDDGPKVPVLEETHNAETKAPQKLRCAKLQPGIEPLERRAGVANYVYEDGLHEHPGVPGLMLTRDERTYGALLEIVDEDGEIRTETLDEKRYRVRWKAPIPVGVTESQKNFTQMDTSLFNKKQTA